MAKWTIKRFFFYHQNENILWADYCGGEIKKGSMVGTVAMNGEIDFHYQHINLDNQIRIGKCHSIPQILSDGRIELSEQITYRLLAWKLYTINE